MRAMSTSGLETQYDGPGTVRPVVPRAAGSRTRQRFRRWGWAGAGVLGTAALFGLYLRQAYAAPTGSDGAVLALQAWDMLHGNPLLRGWTLPDMTFYTIELPELMVTELFRGLRMADIHLVEAVNYTLLVVLAVLLAKGKARGRAGAVRVGVAAAILLAPGPGVATTVAFTNPDHLGTQLLVLAAWLILDRARPSAWVPVTVALLLAWAQVSDAMTLIEGTVPLLAVSALRAYRHRRGPLREQWYDLSLAAAAIAADAAANLVLGLIRNAGGFRAYPLDYTFAYVDTLYQHVWLTAETVLALFGADFSGQQLQPQAQPGTWAALLHLAGVALVCWALAVAARRPAARTRTVQLLAAGSVVPLLLFTALDGFSVAGGAHDLLPVLPLGAVLAGRVLAGRLIRRDLVLALAVPFACCAALFASSALGPPPPPSAQQQLASWLQDRHLGYGLAAYWTASAVDLLAGNRVRVVPIDSQSFAIDRSQWNNDASWYDPRLHQATFLVLPAATPGCPAYTIRGWEKAAANTFGPPARIVSAGNYLVLIWHRNLLRDRLPLLPPPRPAIC
jgi:hypothetical protein